VVKPEIKSSKEAIFNFDTFIKNLLNIFSLRLSVLFAEVEKPLAEIATIG